MPGFKDTEIITGKTRAHKGKYHTHFRLYILGAYGRRQKSISMNLQKKIRQPRALNPGRLCVCDGNRKVLRMSKQQMQQVLKIQMANMHRKNVSTSLKIVYIQMKMRYKFSTLFF